MNQAELIAYCRHIAASRSLSGHAGGIKDAMNYAADELERLQDAMDGYMSITEALQELCDEFGCLGGEHRMNFLRTRLGALCEALQDSRCPSDGRGTTRACVEAGLCGCCNGLLLRDWMERRMAALAAVR